MSHPLTAPDATSAGTPTDHHEQRIARLRAAVDWLDRHPESQARVSEQYDDTVELLDTSTDTAEHMATMARLIGGKWAKKEAGHNGNLLELTREIHPGVTYRMLAWRHEVCTRAVIGTKEREVTEPDPDLVATLPTTTRTEVEEIVEWRCPSSLLAATENGDRA